MSKKRLYEIAKEVGVESKVVVAKAQELGLSVKSHSSSVEEADANRITSSLKGGTAKAESKPAPKATPTPKEEKVAPKVDKVPVAKSAPAKETSKAEVKEAPATPKKPQSRNFKAEREARAKAEAERRQNGGGRDNRNRNRNQQGNDQGKRQNNDRRNQNGNGQGNRNNGNRDNNSNRDRNFQGKQRNDQGRNKRNDAARNNQAGPRIDFKARAAALKAEQNAEYSRQSETRFREEKAAEQRRAKEQEKARKEKQQAEVAAQKAVAEAKPAPKPAPVAQPAPAAQAQDTRRKKARPDKSRDNRRENEDGPKQTRNNKWNNQNQVRNQRNSNWNKNKNKKGKNNRGNSAPKPVTERKFHELPKEFEYTEGMTVAEIAKRIKREPAEIVKKLFMMGVMATQNQSLDGDTIELLMVDYGIEATKKEEVDNADIERFFVDEDYLNKDAMVERAPVVTIMGHVDHGKTTLLDTLRNSRVATGEAGGITQHIGAYVVSINGQKITFLDTPGHEAFTAMRLRGAKSTDIAILVVAADDGVMPQTIEAINHAQAAGVPMVFAINKIDKPGANPDHIKEQLSQMNYLVESWGGKYQDQEISAKKGINLDKLLEKVLLEAEMLELKANPNKKAVGTVIESTLDKGRGYVSTVLVQAGTLRIGDVILSGTFTGRVKAMFNENGKKVTEAGPSTPVQVLGLNGAPQAGDLFNVMDDDRSAREIANKREQLQRMQGIMTQKHVTLDEIGRRIAIGSFKELNIIVKGDVDGSVEAMSGSLIKLSKETVQVNVIHAAVGQISESDVLLAAASNAIIVGFNVRPDPVAEENAKRDGVDMRLYRIIYDCIEEIESAMKGMLAPKYREVFLGKAECREVYKITNVGMVIGGHVTSGKIVRGAQVRLVRDGIIVADDKIASLRRFKDDVKEVQDGYDLSLIHI